MRRLFKYLLSFFLFFFSLTSLNAFEFDEIGVVETHGYISQGFLKSDANNYFMETEEGSYDFKEVGVSLSTDISEHLRISIQFLSYAMGDFGSDDFHVNWANADYSFKEWFSFKAGKLKIFHGIFNRNRDADFLRTNILLPQSVYNESWRSTISALNGLEFYGSLDMGLIGRLNYNFQSGVSKIESDSGVALAAKEQLAEQSSSFFEGAQFEYTPLDVKEDNAYVGRLLWFTPLRGLKINFTGWFVSLDIIGSASGSIDLNGINIGSFESGNTILMADAKSYTGTIEYTRGNFHFISEYSLSTYDFEISVKDFESDIIGLDITSIPPGSIDSEGYYANIMYRFTDWLEVGVYYSEYYADKDDKSGEENYEPSHSAWQKDSCLSLRFDISENWVLKFEGHYIDGTAIMMKSHNIVDFDLSQLDLTSEWLLFGLKLTFSF